jgi:ribosomal protein L37AE/L43A
MNESQIEQMQWSDAIQREVVPAYNIGEYDCPECEYRTLSRVWNYCPQCGAKLNWDEK